jgi:hypothetical protein
MAQSGSNILELITCEADEPRKLHGIVIGKLINFDHKGEPLVDFVGNHRDAPIAARSTTTLGKEAIGQDIVLMFDEGDCHRPIVMGLVQHSGEQNKFALEGKLGGQSNSLVTEIDGERLVFTAQREIVLRCGDASITLTRTGKVLIRGTYVLNHSFGLNRIKGGSVQIN